jgi:hypothetical protein
VWDFIFGLSDNEWVFLDVTPVFGTYVGPTNFLGGTCCLYFLQYIPPWLCPQNILRNGIDIPNYMGSHLEVTTTQCSERELTGGVVSVIHTRWQERIFCSCAPSIGAIFKFRVISRKLPSSSSLLFPINPIIGTYHEDVEMVT